MKDRRTVRTTTEGFVIWTVPGVLPINSVDEGLERGGFNSHCSSINRRTVLLVRAAERERTLRVVRFNRALKKDEHIGLLRKLGLWPCGPDGPNYLLGLLALVSEEQIPRELAETAIVTVNPLFHDSRFQRRCFLCCRHGGGVRELGLMEADSVRDEATPGSKKWSENWAFLAQRLPPESRRGFIK